MITKCVILFAPKKKKIDEKYLKAAFKNNPDGAGVMFYDWKGNVNFKKGFMEFEELLEFWNKLDDRLPRAIHCRIATSGAISEKTCHPFIITESMDEMEKTEGIAKNGCLMHNGVLTDYEPNNGLKSSYSDTMAFNSQVIAPIVRARCVNNDGVATLLENLGSRLLLFLPKFKVVKFGTWVTDKEGFEASNNSYASKSYFGFLDSKSSWDNGWINDYPLEYSNDKTTTYDTYDEELIKTTYPRWEFNLEFVAKENENPEKIIDDFCCDMEDFLINYEQPYYTYYLINNIDLEECKGKLYGFRVATYHDIECLMPKGFIIREKTMYDEDTSKAK